jgi:hypothetical protein
MQNTNRNSDEIFDIVASALENDWNKVRDLIAQSRRRGAGLGQDIGIAYSRGAFLSDGSDAPAIEDPINDYIPSARPGSRAPHLWIERNGAKLSALDLFGGKFVLLTGIDCGSTSLDSESVVVLQNGKDFAANGFEELYGISARGAVLVRPDGYVGARWPQLPQNFSEQLQSAFDSILHISLASAKLSAGSG